MNLTIRTCGTVGVCDFLKFKWSSVHAFLRYRGRGWGACLDRMKCFQQLPIFTFISGNVVHRVHPYCGRRHKFEIDYTVRRSQAFLVSREREKKQMRWVIHLEMLLSQSVPVGIMLKFIRRIFITQVLFHETVWFRANGWTRRGWVFRGMKFQTTGICTEMYE